MQFENTQTFKNLARSFAGECQAGMRYQMIAQLATDEKLKTLADAIRTIAKNETVHATQFFNKMIEKTGNKDNVLFEAGYPFHAGTLEEGLKFAVMDERNETEDIYPTFARIAKEEGFEDIAKLFSGVAKIEKEHEERYLALLKNIEDGTVFKKNQKEVWICRNCGHIVDSAEAPNKCPICDHPQAYFQLRVINY